MRSLRQLPEIIAVPVEQRQRDRSTGRLRIGDQMLRQLKRQACLSDPSVPFQQQSVMKAPLTVGLRDMRGLSCMAKKLRRLNWRVDAMQRVMLFGKVKRWHGLPFSARRRFVAPDPEPRS